MRKYFLVGLLAGLWAGFLIGIIPGFFKNQVVLLDTNQKIEQKAYTLVYGYWNKQGVLETFK